MINPPNGNSAKTQNDLTSLSIAIASDLHCHHKPDGETQESFLLIGSPRVPPGGHPIQSLIELAKQFHLQADVLICPGDVANRAQREGLSTGMDFLLELKRGLNCSSLMCTLGNHDVNSGKKESSDPFELPRMIHPSFPLEKNQIRGYWADGFSIIEMDTHALLVVLNTVADHTDEETAKRGSFQGYRLELLREQLSQYSSKKYSFRIAMLHHHPLLHSHMNYSSSDVLSNGDQLVDLLAKHTFDIIVHGHKHQPRIRRHNAHGHNMIVFAAGSFSAFLHDLGSTTRNLFHILTLRSSTEDHEFVAQLQTWEYNHGCGWNPTSKRSAGLPYILKFKPKMPSINIEELKNFILKQDVPTIYAQELYEEFPLLEYVLPEELEAIGREMLIHEIKLIFDDNGMLYQIGRTFRKQ